MKFIELSEVNVSQDILKKFDCGHPDFNDFLANEAINCANNGRGVTYVLVDEEEKEVTAILAFCS